jgi:hypothetical protein
LRGYYNYGKRIDDYPQGLFAVDPSEAEAKSPLGENAGKPTNLRLEVYEPPGFRDPLKKIPAILVVSTIGRRAIARELTEGKSGINLPFSPRSQKRYAPGSDCHDR